MVVLFDDDTPLELIKTCKPDILIKGGDYDPSISDKNNPKYIVGSDFVAKNGGSTQVIQFVEGYSSTKLIDRMNR